MRRPAIRKGALVIYEDLYGPEVFEVIAVVRPGMNYGPVRGFRIRPTVPRPGRTFTWVFAHRDSLTLAPLAERLARLAE